MNITEPGIYPNISNNDYHNQTDWISSTNLKYLLPERYNQPPQTATRALDFGSLVHSLILEPDTITDTYTILDPHTVGVKADGTPADNPTATSAWKTAVAGVAAAGRVMVTTDEWDQAQSMRDAVYAHPTAAALFDLEGQNELSGFADVDGVKCRARFDRVAPGVIIDLKTTSSRPGSWNLRNTVRSFGYHLSAAHYLRVAAELGFDGSTFVLVFVEKVAPFRVSVCEFGAGSELLDDGFRQWDTAMERAAGGVDAYEGASGFITL